jgi:hypothetical protein
MMRGTNLIFALLLALALSGCALYDGLTNGPDTTPDTSDFDAVSDTSVEDASDTVDEGDTPVDASDAEPGDASDVGPDDAGDAVDDVTGPCQDGEVVACDCPNPAPDGEATCVDGEFGACQCAQSCVDTVTGNAVYEGEPCGVCARGRISCGFHSRATCVDDGPAHVCGGCQEAQETLPACMPEQLVGCVVGNTAQCFPQGPRITVSLSGQPTTTYQSIWVQQRAATAQSCNNWVDTVLGPHLPATYQELATGAGNLTLLQTTGNIELRFLARNTRTFGSPRTVAYGCVVIASDAYNAAGGTLSVTLEPYVFPMRGTYEFYIQEEPTSDSLSTVVSMARNTARSHNYDQFGRAFPSAPEVFILGLPGETGPLVSVFNSHQSAEPMLESPTNWTQFRIDWNAYFDGLTAADMDALRAYYRQRFGVHQNILADEVPNYASWRGQNSDGLARLDLFHQVQYSFVGTAPEPFTDELVSPEIVISAMPTICYLTGLSPPNSYCAVDRAVGRSGFGGRTWPMSVLSQTRIEIGGLPQTKFPALKTVTHTVFDLLPNAFYPPYEIVASGDSEAVVPGKWPSLGAMYRSIAPCSGLEAYAQGFEQPTQQRLTNFIPLCDRLYGRDDTSTFLDTLVNRIDTLEDRINGSRITFLGGATCGHAGTADPVTGLRVFGAGGWFTPLGESATPECFMAFEILPYFGAFIDQQMHMWTMRGVDYPNALYP